MKKITVVKKTVNKQAVYCLLGLHGTLLGVFRSLKACKKSMRLACNLKKYRVRWIKEDWGWVGQLENPKGQYCGVCARIEKQFVR